MNLPTFPIPIQQEFHIIWIISYESYAIPWDLNALSTWCGNVVDKNAGNSFWMLNIYARISIIKWLSVTNTSKLSTNLKFRSQHSEIVTNGLMAMYVRIHSVDSTLCRSERYPGQSGILVTAPSYNHLAVPISYRL